MDRVAIIRCGSMEVALAKAVALAHPTLLVVDIEPGVIAWNSDAGMRKREILRVNAQLKHAGHEVWFVSNGSFKLDDIQSDVRVTTRAHKPWTSMRRLPSGSAELPRVVIGDQVWTDGLLACRLGATFMLIDLPREGVPLWPRWQRRLSWTPRVIFREVVGD